MRYCVPDILRTDSSYPKVQWNAFGATGKTPGSWDPVESKYYPLIDDIAPLGFEEVMIDVAWWQGDEPDSDQVDWSQGMKKAADYAHEKGLRFGLYWTDNLDMATPQRGSSGRIVCGACFASTVPTCGAPTARAEKSSVRPFAATRGFYDMVDSLAAEIPGFQWENCSGGGRIKDYGAMRRAVKIFNSDTYSPLHVRQAFYDSVVRVPSDADRRASGQHGWPLSPAGVAGIEIRVSLDVDGRSRVVSGCAQRRQRQSAVDPGREGRRQGLRRHVQDPDSPAGARRPTCITSSRARTDENWDGIEYYDPVTGKGVVFLFKPSREIMTQVDPVQRTGSRGRRTDLRFEDGTQPLVRQVRP